MSGQASEDRHPLVSAVAAALDHLDDQRAQDEADFLLLGGSIERHREARPGCDFCGGTGVVCSCHGIALWRYERHPKDEWCSCVRVLTTALSGSEPAVSPPEGHPKSLPGSRHPKEGRDVPVRRR